MATIKIHDWAHEFRIEIIGRFSGRCINEASEEWERALGEASPRRITVDITRLSGYDAAGRQLLADMHRHGTIIAASTPLSLVFLHEITDTRELGPALVVDSQNSRKPSKAPPVRLRAHAAGE